MSRSCHTARLGSLGSSRMMAESGGSGSRSGTVSPAASVTGSVGSAGASAAATSPDSGGGTSQAVSSRPHRRRAEEDGRDVMASITSGSRRGGEGVVSTGSLRSTTRAGNRAGTSGPPVCDCVAEDVAILLLLALQFCRCELAELVCVGGWPGHLGSSLDDPPLSVADAMAENRDYLERLMLVEDQPPWSPHLRSRSRLRAASRRHLVDPSLAVAALSAGPDHLLHDFEWFGFLFESMVVRDLRIYAQASGASVFHYRDNTGLEVDAVVDAGPGRWAAFEIKLGTGRVDEGARTLLKFADRVDTDRCGEPAALGVIVGSGYGYARPDGVRVIPVGGLGV